MTLEARRESRVRPGSDKCCTDAEAGNPYDAFPYRSSPIEWSAPERLAACSALHAGPLPRLTGYRVLELGCGDGANLLPLAHYREHSEFVGVDSSQVAIGRAEQRRRQLRLGNVRFIAVDFTAAGELLGGSFDFIIAHGVVSWVSPPVRDALLELCARRLAPGGLFYLNYNTNPGWKVRGMVRRSLLAHTAHIRGLRERAEAAQAVARSVAASMASIDHAYCRLMAHEYTFVGGADPSYVAHEFLAPENHAYWRSDFARLMAARGFRWVADADFNYDTGRVPDDVADRAIDSGLVGLTREDMLDLIGYRQLHSPIFTNVAADPASERGPCPSWFLASPLVPVAPGERPGGQLANRFFRHPSGYEVEVKEQPLASALETVAPLWPRGVRLGEVVENVPRSAEDLRLLHRHGMLELRLAEPASPEASAVLRACEGEWGGHYTSPYHTRHLAQQTGA